MAIEGPLRELGIHDVFQLLDLSRKTGMLRVTSELRDDEGLVTFDNGRVVQATIRSKAVPTEMALLQAGRVTEADIERARTRSARTGRDIIDNLVEIGAITHKELERQLRLQIESVVFELMSWREGFFSFEERAREDIPHDTRITVSTESLLMEGARRIDEWSRIEDVIPSLDVIPELAAFDTDRDGGATLDLLPHEWQVLVMIDGQRDLRGIAASLGRDEFEIAKIAYGLATTGVVVVGMAKQRKTTPVTTDFAAADPSLPMSTVRFIAADLTTARSAIEQILRMSPNGPVSPEARDALEALMKLQKVLETRTAAGDKAVDKALTPVPAGASAGGAHG